MRAARTILMVVAMAVSTLNTDILTASLGRPIALAYGKHWVRGNVILLDESDASQKIAFVALGEGEWDAIEQLFVHGVEIDLNDIGTKYHFHRGGDGELSSGSTLDPEGIGSPYPFDTQGDQRVDGFLPFALQGTTFSRTAYLALQIPYDIFAPSPELDIVGVYRTRRVRTFASNGVQTGYLFSRNPAWQLLDLLTTVRGLSDSRIDYPSFVAAADYCDAAIDQRGDGELNNRFTSDVAFTEEVDFDTALDALLATCRGHLSDTEGTIKLRIDQARASVFDFQDHDLNASVANIVDGSFETWYQDTRAVPNRLELLFRDLANGYQPMSKLWNHEPQQTRTGRVIPSRISLGNMTQGQAERIGNYLLTRAIDNNLFCRFAATGSSLKVMPGDVVRVKHDAAPWSQLEAGTNLYGSFEVLEVTENPDETRTYLCRVYSAATYSDTAGPAQNLIGTTIRRRPLPPLAPPLWGLTANLSGNLKLRFAIPVNTDYREGHLELLVDDPTTRFYGGGEDTVGFTLLNGGIDAEQTTIAVNHVPGTFQVGDYVTQALEILRITGPGLAGADPGAAWEVQRGVLGTVGEAHGDNTTVRRLIWKRFHFVIPNGWSLQHPTVPLANGEYYNLDLRPGALLVLFAKLTMYDRLGQASPASELLYNDFIGPLKAGALPGLRVYKGVRHELVALSGGPLRIGADIIPKLTLGPDECIGLMYAVAERGPMGTPITFQVLKNGVAMTDSLFGPEEPVIGEIATVDAPGQPSSSGGTFARGDFQGNLEEVELGIEFLQVGAGDEPGEGVRVIVIL